MNDDNLREALAAYAHNAWSGWMIYLFSKCTEHTGGFYTIPVWAVQRWKRQMSTNYCDLPEGEQESDRAEADKMLALLGASLAALRATNEEQEREIGRLKTIERAVMEWYRARQAYQSNYTLKDRDARHQTVVGMERAETTLVFMFGGLARAGEEEP